MELDLWEGQFNLSSLPGLEGLTEEEYEDFSRSSTCWGQDSVVTMGTVRSSLSDTLTSPWTAGPPAAGGRGATAGGTEISRNQTGQF